MIKSTIKYDVFLKFPIVNLYNCFQTYFTMNLHFQQKLCCVQLNADLTSNQHN